MKRLLIITLLLISLSATASATITYDSGNNIITVTGYTEATPCTFTDIYDADQSGGWGVVSKQGGAQFYLNCGLYLGDGSTVTYLASENEHIKIATKLRWTANSHFRMGNIDGNNDTFDGGLLEVDGTSWTDDFGNFDMSTGDVEASFYNSKIITGAGIIFGVSSGSTFRAVDCLIVCKGYALYGTSTVLKNIIMDDITKGVGVRATYTTDIENVTIQKSTYGLFFYAHYVGTARNVIVKNTIYDIKVQQSDVTHYMVDTICNWIFDWRESPDARVDRQYTFNLKMIDKDGTPINGATVKIWDKDNTLVVDTTTDANGVIAIQTISRGYYNQVNGNTLQDYSPHHIKIEKAGYTTYDVNFTLEEKTDWMIALQKYNNACNNTCDMLSTEINLIDQKYHEYAHIGYQTMHIPIYTGLNYISIPLYQYNTTLATLFGDHPVTNDTMKKYVNGVWNVSTYNNGTWNNANNIEPIKPCVGYEYNRTGDNFTLNVSGFMKYNIDIFNYKNRVGTNIIRPMRSDKND